MTYSLPDLRSRLALLDADVQAKEAALAEARARRDGAEAFVSALEAEAAQAAALPPARLRGAEAAQSRGFRHSTGNADIIGGIIAEHPEGVHLRDIQRIVAERGHDFDGEQVRSAVTYLRRRGDAENIRRGVWRPARPGAENSNGPADARPFALAPSPIAAASGAG